MDNNMIDEIKSIYKQCDGIVITSGAGMSVDSGIPDFRGNSGLWTAEKDNFIKFATADTFFKLPLEAWNFYVTRFMKYSSLKPHDGYFKLRELTKEKDVYIVTSNVDEHFAKSGWDPEKIYEIHGDIRHTQCSKRCCDDTYDMPKFENELMSEDEIPKCPQCGSNLRPHALLFEDYWFIFDRIEQQIEKYKKWEQDKKFILGIEIGAGNTVPSIRQFGEIRTHVLIRINPYDTQLNRKQDYIIPQTALNGIDTLMSILK